MQSHFDNGSERAALNWLLTLQQKEDAERWRDGIGYLLARATESAKEYDVAVERLGEDTQSTQAHGNLILRSFNQSIDRTAGIGWEQLVREVASRQAQVARLFPGETRSRDSLVGFDVFFPCLVDNFLGQSGRFAILVPSRRFQILPHELLVE